MLQAMASQHRSMACLGLLVLLCGCFVFAASLSDTVCMLFLSRRFFLLISDLATEFLCVRSFFQ